VKNTKEIKVLLIQARDDLAVKLQQMSQEQFSDGQVQDPADQAIASTMESLQSSLQETELNRYKTIVRAIQKIEDGSYGMCIDCGNEISEKRLLSFPEAARCISCEEARENADIFL
jgi:DnaK suppressor protein